MLSLLFYFTNRWMRRKGLINTFPMGVSVKVSEKDSIRIPNWLADCSLIIDRNIQDRFTAYKAENPSSRQNS